MGKSLSVVLAILKLVVMTWTLDSQLSFSFFSSVQPFLMYFCDVSRCLTPFGSARKWHYSFSSKHQHWDFKHVEDRLTKHHFDFLSSGSSLGWTLCSLAASKSAWRCLRADPLKQTMPMSYASLDPDSDRAVKMRKAGVKQSEKEEIHADTHLITHKNGMSQASGQFFWTGYFFF